MLDHRFQGRDHRLAAIQAKALGADILLAEEFLILLAPDNRSEDRLLAFG